MRKLILLLLPLLIIGCEKTFDNLIDTSRKNYQVSLVGPTSSFNYSVDDSLITITIFFTIASEVSEVFCDIIASDGAKLNSSPFQLYDNNDNRFENKFPLSTYYPSGKYTINYYVSSSDGTLKLVAQGSFKYNNGQDNVAPIIANTVIEPDTVVVTAPTVIFTSVEASDSNGQNDILKVFFVVYRPDGTTNGNELELFDDGNIADHGDQSEGDGIYSILIQVDENNDKGTYRFEFKAKDRAGAYSNTINHFVLIQE